MDISFLVKKAKDRDITAFAELYSMFSEDMYRFALYMLNSKEDAEDAVHTAFMRIAKNIEIIKTDGDKTTGLMITIARNAAIDLYRKRIKQSTVELMEDIAAPESEPVMDELAACILNLLESLLVHVTENSC